MSVERSLEAWEEVQRHGQDLADRLAQGFSDLLHHPPPFPWSHNSPPTKPFAASGVAASVGPAILDDIGGRIGRVGADFSNSLNGLVQQLFRQLPVPFLSDSATASPPKTKADVAAASDQLYGGGGLRSFGVLENRFGDVGTVAKAAVVDGEDETNEDDFTLDVRGLGQCGRPQGTFKISSTYDSRTNEIESSIVARGDLWRAEASHGGSTSGSENSRHFLVQLGPVLFVRNTTLLLPVHLSKQHLLWYGYDRQNGMHSLCPALWSKHRRWLFMSMICLNPFACSFMDLQFPNGQLTYVAGEGLTTSAFFPVFGGLLQAQGQLPGEMRFSFSCKNKRGTRITPAVQWPDKSFSLGVVQALAWKRYGLMERPSMQFSICPTFGGSNPGLRAEYIHSIQEKLSLICGCAYTVYPSAFASVSLGKSKWNGNIGKSGVVLRLETPLSNIGRPSFSVQLNSGFDF